MNKIEQMYSIENMTKLEKIKLKSKIRKLKRITRKIIKLKTVGDVLAEELTEIYRQNI